MAEVFGQVWDMQCMLHCYIHLSEVPLAFSGEVSAVSAVSVVSPPESKGNFCIFLAAKLSHICAELKTPGCVLPLLCGPFPLPSKCKGSIQQLHMLNLYLAKHRLKPGLGHPCQA